MYDTITPEQWIMGLVISLLAFGGLVWLLWHSFPRDEPRSHMSTSAEPMPAPPPGTAPVHVPVLHTGTAERTTPGVADGTNVAAPDTDGANGGTDGWNTPRISTRLSDTETIALLAAQRGKDGKHRYSANQIHNLVGGARADVLAQVRALRTDAPAVFRPLSDEQQLLREQRQLDKR